MSGEEAHSLTAFRQLYPILVDEAGEVIDGKHRLQADPNWKKMKVEGIKTTKDRLIARMVANGCRREIPAKEKKRWVNDLAKILKKEGIRAGGKTFPPDYEIGIATTISRLTGWTEPTVHKYLADRFKGDPPKRTGRKKEDDGGVCESLNCLRKAVVTWSKELKEHPERKRSPSEVMDEALTLQIQNRKLVCPHCNKPATILLWGCCKKRFAGGK